MMIKSGKDMEKATTSPMFPRLSLNDTENRGRKAPPRNKMALYEQLSIIPTLNGTHLVPSNSSSHDAGHDQKLPNSLFPFNVVGSTIPTATDALEQESFVPTNLSTTNGNTRVPLFSTIQRSFDKSKLTNLTSIPPFKWQPTNVEDTRSKGTHVGAELNYSIQPKTPRFSRESRSPERHNKTTRLSQESAATRKENIATSHHDFDDGQDHRSLNGHRKRGKRCDEQENETSDKIDGTNGNGGVSEASIVDCCLNISPGDVIGAIGETYFWKARNVLSRQQKIFAEQLFELHRLIKVQKALAASPRLSLEDNFTSSKSSMPSGTVTGKFGYDHVLHPADHITRTKDRSQEANSTTDSHSDNAVTKIPLPSFNTQLITQRLDHGLTSPWCYVPPPMPPPPPSPINQWLIPIMSPSQGLVYKPYTGLFPPPTGLMPPVYSPSKDYFDSLTNQTYLPSYITPIMRPPTSNSGFHQTSVVSGSRVNEAANLTSAYMTNKKNKVNDEKCVSSSKHNELLCSTDSSSPSEVEECNAMPLFPVEPTLQAEKETPVLEQTRVIKAVPHNPRAATETAARIFRLIQEERENCV